MGLRDWNLELAFRYGGKKPFFRYHFTRIIWTLGGFRRFYSRDWHNVSRLVFVCKGNICRSPYAEERARALGFSSYSFGLEAKDGNPADSTAQEAALKRGLNLSGHRTRSVEQFTPGPSDLLIGMEPAHAKRLQQLYGETTTQVSLLGLWHSPPMPHIQDPYGLSSAYFETCFTILDQAIEQLGERIKAFNVSLAAR